MPHFRGMKRSQTAFNPLARFNYIQFSPHEWTVYTFTKQIGLVKLDLMSKLWIAFPPPGDDGVLTRLPTLYSSRHKAAEALLAHHRALKPIKATPDPAPVL